MHTTIPETNYGVINLTEISAMIFNRIRPNVDPLLRGPATYKQYTCKR